MHRLARITVASAIIATSTVALAGTAVADDAHQACTRTVLCTGNVVDLHDLTTHSLVPILSLIG